MRLIIYNLVIFKKDVFIMGKHYDQEYKQYVSKLIVDEGRVAREVSYELDIPYGTLCRWVQHYKKQKKAGDGSLAEKYITPSEHEKALGVRDKEIRKLKEENEILKKAMHIFTQEKK